MMMTAGMAHKRKTSIWISPSRGSPIQPKKLQESSFLQPQHDAGGFGSLTVHLSNNMSNDMLRALRVESHGRKNRLAFVWKRSQWVSMSDLFPNFFELLWSI
jgi:hypothetical protein